MSNNITGRRKWTLTPWFKNNVRNIPDWANYFLKVRWLQVFLKVAFLVELHHLVCWPVYLINLFFSFLGTSSIKIFLLFLWNGHFNCLHFTSYMVCSMDIYWSGKDYFGTHLFVVYADNFLLIKVLFLHLWLWFHVLNLEFALKVLTSHYSLRLISAVICFL